MMIRTFGNTEITRRLIWHSLATNVESIEDAKYILGHESVVTSEIYRHIIDKKMKDRFKHQELQEVTIKDTDLSNSV